MLPPTPCFCFHSYPFCISISLDQFAEKHCIIALYQPSNSPYTDQFEWSLCRGFQGRAASISLLNRFLSSLFVPIKRVHHDRVGTTDPIKWWHFPFRWKREIYIDGGALPLSGPGIGQNQKSFESRRERKKHGFRSCPGLMLVRVRFMFS